MRSSATLFSSSTRLCMRLRLMLDDGRCFTVPDRDLDRGRRFDADLTLFALASSPLSVAGFAG